MLPNMTDGEFYGDTPDTDNKHSTGALHISEPYPYDLWNDCDVWHSGYDVDALVPNGFWEIKAKQRTYNGVHKICKKCGIICKCAN